MQQKDYKEQSKIITTTLAMVAPYESFRESSGDTVDPQTKHSNETKTDGEAVVTSDLDKELLVEQKYWEQYGSAAKKMDKLKSKYPMSQRLTLKEHNIIDKAKITERHPSSYQIDEVTAAVLERLQKEKHVGPLQNVAGKGINSVVIYSPRKYHPCGEAVKVYKLSKDVKKNSSVLKRAQREFDHLTILCFCCGAVPQVEYKYKNVTVMNFIGDDQETAPSINSVPLERSKEMYDAIVMNMHIWYKKQIVHGKLSSKYIRIYSGYPFFLGWSHSVRTEHPQALKKLMRDCHFITQFFERRDVQVKPTEELFKDITQLDKISKDVLDTIYNDRNLWQDEHQTNPNRREDTCRSHGNCRFK